MTTKWLSYRVVPLQGHLHVANQQQQKKQSSLVQSFSCLMRFHNADYIFSTQCQVRRLFFPKYVQCYVIVGQKIVHFFIKLAAPKMICFDRNLSLLMLSIFWYIFLLFHKDFFWLACRETPWRLNHFIGTTLYQQQPIS